MLFRSERVLRKLKQLHECPENGDLVLKVHGTKYGYRVGTSASSKGRLGCICLCPDKGTLKNTTPEQRELLLQETSRQICEELELTQQDQARAAAHEYSNKGTTTVKKGNTWDITIHDEGANQYWTTSTHSLFVAYELLRKDLADDVHEREHPMSEQKPQAEMKKWPDGSRRYELWSNNPRALPIQL